MFNSYLELSCTSHLTWNDLSLDLCFRIISKQGGHRTGAVGSALCSLLTVPCLGNGCHFRNSWYFKAIAHWGSWLWSSHGNGDNVMAYPVVETHCHGRSFSGRWSGLVFCLIRIFCFLISWYSVCGLHCVHPRLEVQDDYGPSLGFHNMPDWEEFLNRTARTFFKSLFYFDLHEQLGFFSVIVVRWFV